MVEVNVGDVYCDDRQKFMIVYRGMVRNVVTVGYPYGTGISYCSEKEFLKKGYSKCVK